MRLRLPCATKRPSTPMTPFSKKRDLLQRFSGESKKLSEDNWIQNFVKEQSNQNEELGDLKKISVAKLKSLLAKLVSQENYENAARVRDELSKRKS